MKRFDAWACIVLAGLIGCGGGQGTADGDAASNQDAVTNDVPTGSDVPAGMDVPVGGDVPVGMDVPTGTDVPTGVDVPTGTDVPVMMGTPPMIMGCRIFPPDNPWNQDVRPLPLHANSAAYIAAMNPTRALHADWGNWTTDHYGIPWQAARAAPPIAFMWTSSWGNSESDPLPCMGGGGNFCYPIPTTARIEGGPMAATDSDRHVLLLDTTGAPNNCVLYETYNTQNFTAAPWRAQNGAIFRLGTNALRMDGWTSADAAGLPILPGLVRVDEVLAGEIRHAVRFTMQRTARLYIHPATHQAGTTGTNLPPMGLRLRLRSAFNVAAAGRNAQVILRAMQIYGIILADNGSDWYITGDSDDRWAPIIDEVITAFRGVHGSDFEVVNTGPTRM